MGLQEQWLDYMNRTAECSSACSAKTKRRSNSPVPSFHRRSTSVKATNYLQQEKHSKIQTKSYEMGYVNNILATRAKHNCLNI